MSRSRQGRLFPAPRPVKKRAKKPVCDKWIIGMLKWEGEQVELTMLPRPSVYKTYREALAAAEEKAQRYGTTFVVFAKAALVGRLPQPINIVEFSL